MSPIWTPLPRLMGILHSGQSLSVGDYGTPPYGTSPKNVNNVQLYDSSGAYSSATSGTWSLAPMVTPARAAIYGDGGLPATTEYPINIGGESPEVTMANTMSALSLAKYLTAWSFLAHCAGQGGAAASVIEKGGTGNAYASLILEATVANAMRVGYAGALAVLTHGESDAEEVPPAYADFLESYQADLQSDMQALIGPLQGKLPLIISQQNSNPFGGIQNNSALDQVAASIANPGVIILSGPKYYVPYYSDRQHLTRVGYQLVGEKYGQVGFGLLSGLGYTPFLPTGITISGNVVTVSFSANVLPLQFSTAFTAPHLSGAYSAWAAGKGFEAWTGGEGGTVVGITSVAVVASNTVQITCASPPTLIGYAHTPDTTSSYTGGFPDGRCGLLTDSDPFVGPITSTAQPNWCPEFSLPVPWSP